MQSSIKWHTLIIHVLFIVSLICIGCIEQRTPFKDPLLDPIDYTLNDLSVSEDLQSPEEDQMLVDLRVSEDVMVVEPIPLDMMLHSDMIALAQPEICNRLDDDLDGKIDEGFTFVELGESILISEGNGIETLSVPKLLSLPNREFFGIWTESFGGYLPTSFGSYINSERLHTLASRLPVHQRNAHWHNAEYEVMGVKAGVVDPVAISTGLFDAMSQESIQSWEVIRNTLLYGLPSGLWTGNYHVIVSKHSLEDERTPYSQYALAITLFSRDGELESNRIVPHESGVVNGPIFSAHNTDANIFIWGDDGRSLGVLLVDHNGNLLSKHRLSDVNYRLTGAKIYGQVAAFGDKWIVVIPQRNTIESTGFMVMILNPDGTEEQRYLVDETQIYDQVSLATSDQLAVVVGRDSNSQVKMWSLAEDRAIHMTSLDSWSRFAIKLIGKQAYILSVNVPDASSEKNVKFHTFECVASE